MLAALQPLFCNGPKKTSDQTDRLIRRNAVANPQASSSEILQEINNSNMVHQLFFAVYYTSITFVPIVPERFAFRVSRTLEIVFLSVSGIGIGQQMIGLRYNFQTNQ